jgi:dTDP-4-amino-4,6-dideoxygalactose transaminase
LASRDDPIFVTRPFLPPLSELVTYLEEIWATRIVTNNGPFHERLQRELEAFLEVPHVSLVANGMLALETALETASLAGEVITTPYSFVATSHAVARRQLTPVFVDIRSKDLNIDPALVEAAINNRTSAIVAVHCYGNPCDVTALDEIARRHGLKLIYDAAHAFAVRHCGRSLVSWGDYATLSFHGTKMFNTFEGGAVITRTDRSEEAVKLNRNFGITSEVTVPVIGTNAKMSEFNAALGLLQLKHLDDAIRARRMVDERYRLAFRDIPGIVPLAIAETTEANYSYFPVLVTEEYPLSRDELYDSLKTDNVFSRRYFFPLLSHLPMYKELPSSNATNLPIANRAADQILCLPIYPDLSEQSQFRVIDHIRKKAK